MEDWYGFCDRTVNFLHRGDAFGELTGMRYDQASNWGLGGLIAAAVLLSPVLASLMALVVDIVIGFLNDGGAPALVVLVAAGAIGGFLYRKLRMRPQDSGADWT